MIRFKIHVVYVPLFIINYDGLRTSGFSRYGVGIHVHTSQTRQIIFTRLVALQACPLCVKQLEVESSNESVSNTCT